MANINEYYPDIVSHPCDTLIEKLDKLGISIKEFVLRTGKPEKEVMSVLKGDSSITPEIATAFENVTRIPADFWLNKQARYDEYIVRHKRN